MKPFWKLNPVWAVIAVQLFLCRGILRGELPFRRDLHRLFVPIKWYIAQAFREGRLPQWWPFEGLGMPLASQPMASLFHPTTAFYALLPFRAAFDLQFFLPLPFAACGTFRLGRALGLRPWPAAIASAAYSLSGYFLSATEFTFTSLAAASLPWVAWGALRLRAAVRWRPAVLTLSLASVVLAGDPVLSYLALAITLILWFKPVAFRQLGSSVRRLLPAVAWSLAIASVQLVPTWLLFSESARATGPVYAATHWSLGARQLLGFVFAAAYPPRSHLFASTFLGVTVAALALIGVAVRGKRRIALAVLAIFSLALASAPVWSLFAKFVPGFYSLRYPIKAIGPAILAIALFAGRGAQWVSRRGHFPLAAAALLGLALVELGTTHRSLLATAGDELWATPPLARQLSESGISLEGASYAYRWEPRLTKDDELAFERDFAASLTPATGAFYGLPTTNAYLPGHSARYEQVSLNEKWLWLGRLSSIYGARYLIGPLGGLRPQDVSKVIARDDAAQVAVLEFPRARPRAYCAFTARHLPAAAIPSYLKSPSFVSGEEVVLEDSVASAIPALETGSAAPYETAQVSRRGDEVEVQAFAPRRCVLVLNESLFRGVRAREGGIELPVFPVNHVVRGVLLEPGAHRVRFTFKTPGLWSGAIISLLAIALVPVHLLFLRKSQKSRRRAPS